MNEPHYFLKLEIENIRSFKKKTVLDLSDGKGGWRSWTIILGDNGTGKTTLLEALASLEVLNIYSHGSAHPAPKSSWTLGYGLYFNKYPLKGNKYSNSYIAGKISNFSNPLDNKINDIVLKINEHGVEFKGEYYHTNPKDTFHIYAYGGIRIMGESSINIDYFDKNTESLFDQNFKLINAEKWLLQLDYAASKESEVKDFAINRRAKVISTIINLLPDVEDIRFTSPTKENLNSNVEFKTYFDWIGIGQLSSGYRSMVSWTIDLASRLFHRYPDSDNPLAEPAIVLVDEIDLHLHPKWQRNIFKYISDSFPKTQFIVTAHSPLIVQSAPMEANIVVLRREKDCVMIDDSVESVQNWRIDQIINSNLFDMNNFRGPNVEEWMRERDELLSKNNLTNFEVERLEELNMKAHALPTQNNALDIEAMKIIREAAEFIKKNNI